MALSELNRHIELCTRRLELEDQALLATAAGDYDQADQCEREINEMTRQLNDELKEIVNAETEERIPNSDLIPPSDVVRIETHDAVEQALEKLSNAELILDHWFKEYIFAEKPDPMLAIAFGAKIPRKTNTLERQSFKWFYEYQNITQFIEIVSDYINATGVVLNTILEKAS
ncbi:MAG: hypothetical protein ABFD08_13060 [Syntrophomonas sp.]